MTLGSKKYLWFIFMSNHILKHQNKILQNIMNKIDELKNLNQIFAENLEPHIVKHCEVVKFEKNCLFVIVENGNWTTQLRFQIPDLIKKLQKHVELQNLNGIICKTRPHHTLGKAEKPRKKMMARLSQETAEHLIATAKLIQDENLKKKLEKIATRAKS